MQTNQMNPRSGGEPVANFSESVFHNVCSPTLRVGFDGDLDISSGGQCITFSSGATELIIRTADGVLRRCRNLCLASILEAVRASAGTTIDIDRVNRMLMQPHWQKEVDLTDF